MPECPICRRQYDEQSAVFVPPHPEAFDTIECAKLAAAAWGTAAAPVILPTIEIIPAPPVAKPKPVAGAPGRRIAALAALALVPGQAALAGGVGLAAAGTAAAIYLAAKPAFAPHPEAASTGSSGAPETSTGGSTGGSPASPVQNTPAARPPDAILAGPRPSSRVRAVVATAHVAHVTGGSSTRSSSPESALQLISRTVPAAQEPASTPKDSRPPGKQQTPAPGATPAPKPRKPKPSPQQPPATPAPPQPSTPAAPAAPVPTPTEDTGTRVLASSDSAPHPSKDENTPPPVPKPPTDQPPPVQPSLGSSGSGDSDDRPGNGWGDKNHGHTGPPGREGGNGGNGGHGGGHGDHH
jgi:hypothetical protein